MTRKHYARLVLGGVALIALLIVWVTFAGGDRSQENLARPTEPLPEELESLRHEAISFQQERKWCAARDAWRQLSEALGDGAQQAPWVEEARNNYQIANQRCEPDSEMLGSGEVLSVEPTSQPAITEPNLIQYYPQGKTIRSESLLDITGRGSNQTWIAREAYFAYGGQFVVETTVLENTGSTVALEATLPLVAQHLAISEDRLRLTPPDSPLLYLFWQMGEPYLKADPWYRAARRLADLVNSIDPGLERSLTWFYQRLKANGIEFDRETTEAQLVAKIDALAGHRFRLVYAHGFGVQTIEMLSGEVLPRDDVASFARNFGLLMDYVVSEVDRIEVGEMFEVKVADVARMIGMNYDVDVAGSITLRREKDENGLAVMSVAEGEVVVEGNVQGVRRKGMLRPKTGIVKYDTKALFVRQAQIEWRADFNWFSEDHLLFGTRGMREVDARSYYEAQQIE